MIFIFPIGFSEMAFPYWFFPPVAPNMRMSREDLDGLPLPEPVAQGAPEEIHQLVAVVHVGQDHHGILGASGDVPRGGGKQSLETMEVGWKVWLENPVGSFFLFGFSQRSLLGIPDAPCIWNIYLHLENV